jgi:hypothetical protein
LGHVPLTRSIIRHSVNLRVLARADPGETDEDEQRKREQRTVAAKIGSAKRGQRPSHQKGGSCATRRNAATIREPKDTKIHDEAD